MDATVIGYQYGDDLSYIGTYAFPNNLDRASIHLPPRTTLIQPPIGLPAGQEAYFDEAQQAWLVRAEDLSWMGSDSLAKMQAAQEAGNGTQG